MDARQDIIETITNVFVGTDARDWKRVQSCFAARVLFDMTSMTGGQPANMTPKEITDGWETGLKPIDAIHHQAGNFLVRVDAEQAEAFCYALAYHYRKTKSGRNTRLFAGSYDFHLVNSFERWLIDRFRFNLKFIDGNAELEKD
jgi:hypothetical protein